MSTEKPWEEEARNWVKWARTPDHDVFSCYAPSFCEEVVPPARRLTLEIGCGEGRVARRLASRAHNVVALDSSSTLVQFARDADAQSAYLSADATALPFADVTFQTVVAYNSLQTTAMMVDMAQAVQEAGRVSPAQRADLAAAHACRHADDDRGAQPLAARARNQPLDLAGVERAYADNASSTP